MQNFNKIAVIGCGNVGSTIAYTLAISKQYTDIVLIDVDVQKAKGEAQDISHTAPYVGNINVYAGDYSDILDAGITIITAGANQKPGQTRLQLVNMNVEVMRSIIPKIAQSSYEGVILIVSNPVDIMTYVAKMLMKQFNPTYPLSKIVGTGTVLDTARLKSLLGERLLVDSRSIHAFIIGEHGDSEIVAWSSANVSGIPLGSFCLSRGFCDVIKETAEIAEQVKRSAYEIIEKKGATYYGIAMVTKRICEAIANNERSVLPVSRLMVGEYGIYDVVMSIPTIVGQSGAESGVLFKLNEMEQCALKASADILRGILNDLELPKT